MAEVDSIEMRSDDILLNLRISKEEYEFLKQATSDLMVIPVSSRFMNRLFTTGKLGNSSRLMLPKKALDKLDAKRVERKVPGRLFRLEGGVYILARLHGKNRGMPAFGGEENE